ncbi:MAG: hypothetical protein AAGA62_15005, partial [Bacteroidota bacterium]
PNGRYREQIGTVQVPQTTTTVKRYYNFVSSLDIPILLGYRIKDNRWKMLLEAGPTINLSSGGAAHRLADGGAIPVAGNYFLPRRTGLGFLGQVTGEYGVSETQSLTAGLRFQSFGGSFVNPETSGRNAGYGMISLRVGYRMRF